MNLVIKQEKWVILYIGLWCTMLLKSCFMTWLQCILSYWSQVVSDVLPMLPFLWLMFHNYTDCKLNFFFKNADSGFFFFLALKMLSELFQITPNVTNKQCWHKFLFYLQIKCHKSDELNINGRQNWPLNIFHLQHCHMSGVLYMILNIFCDVNKLVRGTYIYLYLL